MSSSNYLYCLEEAIKQQRLTITHKLEVLDRFYSEDIVMREELHSKQARIIRFIREQLESEMLADQEGK